jgi:membrane associated rhomboid family serine protease
LHGRGYQGGGLGFGPPFTPPIVKKLLIANGIVFVIQLAVPSFTDLFGVVPLLFWQQGFLWQPFTYMWLHSTHFIGHILMNLFVLWMFGAQLAMAWGPKRFMRYYLICGIGAGFFIATVPYVSVALGISHVMSLGITTVGASGAIYGVLLAYSLTWPDRTIMLIFPPVAFRAIWLIPALFFMAFFFGGANVSHVGHLGGVVVGWLYLRRSGDAHGLLSFERIKYRWRRYRMRRRLRAIQYEEWESRRRENDHRFH